jgi:hypothetical protein
MTKQNVKKPMSIMDFFKRNETTTIVKSVKTEKCPVCNAVIYLESQSFQVHVNTCLDAQSTSSTHEIESKPVLIPESTTITITTNDDMPKKRKLPTLNPSASSSKNSNSKKPKRTCPFYKWMRGNI